MSPEQKAKRAELERIRQENNRPGKYVRLLEDQKPQSEDKFPGMFEGMQDDFLTDEMRERNEELQRNQKPEPTPTPENDEELFPDVDEDGDGETNPTFRDLIDRKKKRISERRGNNVK